MVAVKSSYGSSQKFVRLFSNEKLLAYHVIRQLLQQERLLFCDRIVRHCAIKHCLSHRIFLSLSEKRKRNTEYVPIHVKYMLKAPTKASVVKIICYICAGISIPYIIGMAYCQLIHYSKSPKQREQKSRQLMLFPVSVYECHPYGGNLILRQAWRKYFPVLFV